MQTQLNIEKCACGWSFYKRFEKDIYCPQCRHTLPKRYRKNMTCVCCGEKIEVGQHYYCKNCAKTTALIIKRVRCEIFKGVKIKETKRSVKEKIIESDIELSDKTFISDCGVDGMDCERCPLPDCVLKPEE